MTETEKIDVQRRRPRFERAPTPELRLTPRDVDLVRAVAAHRFLRSTHLVALSGGSPQKILRRLQLLYHHRYLDRPKMQLDFYERGSEPMVYALGNRGADLLAKEDGCPRGKVNWSAKNGEATRAFLRHTLFVADLMVGFELGARALGHVGLISQGEILARGSEEPRCTRQPLGWRVRVREGGETAELGILPDKFFGLRFEDEPEGKNRSYFFLEADRGTMPVRRQGLIQSSVYRKFLAYAETWRHRLHTRHFGIRYFRVLTVAPTLDRVRHLLEAQASLPGGGSPLFLFAASESLRSGNPLTHPWIDGLGETIGLME